MMFKSIQFFYEMRLTLQFVAVARTRDLSSAHYCFTSNINNKYQ